VFALAALIITTRFLMRSLRDIRGGQARACSAAAAAYSEAKTSDGEGRASSSSCVWHSARLMITAARFLSINYNTYIVYTYYNVYTYVYNTSRAVAFCDCFAHHRRQMHLCIVFDVI